VTRPPANERARLDTPGARGAED